MCLSNLSKESEGGGVTFIRWNTLYIVDILVKEPEDGYLFCRWLVYQADYVSWVCGFLFPSQWDSVTVATSVDGMEAEQSSFRCLFVSKYAWNYLHESVVCVIWWTTILEFCFNLCNTEAGIEHHKSRATIFKTKNLCSKQVTPYGILKNMFIFQDISRIF